MPASFFSSSNICLLVLLASVVVQYATAESLIAKSLATGKFGILNVALQSYNVPTLIENLGGLKVTIFGPTDAAFTAAGITDGSAIAEDVLMRHAILGEYTVATISAKTCQEMPALAQGITLVMETASDGSITVNGVKVNTALADMAGDEGVFHGIDGIIPAEYRGCSAAGTSAPEATADSGSFQRRMLRPLLLVVVSVTTVFTSWVW